MKKIIILLFLLFGIGLSECPITPYGSFKLNNLNQSLLEPGWGYGYDELQEDIDIWEQSPFIKVDTLGFTQENRAIIRLVLQDTIPFQVPFVVNIHNRTHPLEVQSWWVQKEMIEYLISDNETAAKYRQEMKFYMIPMMNPDGVERMEDCTAGFGRCNASGVDIEREWASLTPQEEVKIVKEAYQIQMNSLEPIEVLLNMHSAFGCDRYFWYHHASGTSEEYAYKEQAFIKATHGHFSGIENWDFKTSWSESAPDHYPESWFWYQFGSQVLALTYEDVKECESKEINFNPQAMALLNGLYDYFTIDHEILPLVQTEIQNKGLNGRFDVKGKPVDSPCSLSKKLKNAEICIY